MLLRCIQLKNFLSYGPNSQPLTLQDLNIIIGTNGSGKSNLLEAIALLKSTPQELVRPINLGGSVRDWIWKDPTQTLRPTAHIEVIVDKGNIRQLSGELRYWFEFIENGGRFEIVDERIEYAKKMSGKHEAFFFYKYENGHPILNVNTAGTKGWIERTLQRERINPEKSIFAQRYDPDTYLEISYLSDVFKDITIYRDWSFGPFAQLRQPQRPDISGKYLAEDMSNLAIILGRVKKNHIWRNKFLEFFQAAYEEIEDFELSPEGGMIEINVREGNSIPATRLSDGTLRLMCLLAVLCDPEPPRLICIDEPELGLHPDLVNMMADALRYAAERTQVIVTTHSVGLVDAFTETPDVVVVCEKNDGCTQMRRLVPEELEAWLKDYDLGQLWTRGHIGGTRW